jgi:dihydroorotate dehydrogenase electron transfer subunit
MIGIIKNISRLTDSVVDMRVAIDLRDPAPGRFVHLAAPGFTLRRPISLCGYTDGVARLVFAVKGQGTAALAALNPGDTVNMMGPLGKGFPEEAVHTILVGGGVGLPPLLYYANVHGDRTHAIAGFRSKEQMILTKEFPSIDICTDDGSVGLAYYPYERLETYISLKGKPGQVLACGVYPLLRAVAGVCEKHGVPCYVSMEERMACGVGACLVCACPVGGDYLRCCKDGPVFNAADVDWE